MSVCLSVTLVYCGQMVEWIKVKHGAQHGGRPRLRPHCVRWGPISPQKGRQQPPTFRPMYCGQMAGWIKMPLGMEIGLGSGHSVLDGNPAPPKKGTAPAPISSPCLLWPNGWIDQDATWYGGRPQPRQHCVRWGPSAPPRRGIAPNFRPMSIVTTRSPISATAGHLFYRGASMYVMANLANSSTFSILVSFLVFLADRTLYASVSEGRVSSSFKCTYRYRYIRCDDKQQSQHVTSMLRTARVPQVY